MTRNLRRLAVTVALLVGLLAGAAAAPPQASSKAGDDPVLRALLAEMERSKSQLRLENMQAPYYIEYRLVDADDYSAEATFGALRSQQPQHLRLLRVVVRVGDYKQDSYFGPAEAVVELAPVDDEILALRHQLWLATDQAYKAAAEALAAKQARLKQYSVDQPVDDFARAPALQLLGPLARLDLNPQPWRKLLEDASALYRNDPQVQSLEAGLHFTAVNRYFVNSEGTVVRGGNGTYEVSIAGSTQAPDGMRLDRLQNVIVSDPDELPPTEKFLARASRMFDTLKALREAPLAEEEYHGPVLFSADAADTIMASLIGPNVLGKKPELGQPARTTGAWSSSYKSRVLPEFLSVVDDPTLAAFNGHSLAGHYAVDEEGVQAVRVPLVEKGVLVNYLLGREPIRDFPSSNGHGRAAPPASPAPSLGNLVVQSAQPLSREALKKKLIELCQQRDLPYGYFVETMGPRMAPRLLYRVWTKDGHEELVRGAVFGDLDVRSLRNNLIAAGNDQEVENRADPVPHSIVAPSILFDELEVKRDNVSKDKLPDYPPPPLATAK